jgi:hypothetical protein
MKLIMHIGMGKTGTSSIQNALSESEVALGEQKVRYMGMWFNSIDPSYQGHKGLQELSSSDKETQKKAAQLFSAHLQKLHDESGFEKFILSNEGIWASVGSLKFFIETLSQELDLQIVGFIRNPYDWLPSAFTQWGLLHKQQIGPLQSFRERGEVLLGQYSAFVDWINDFEQILTLRPHNTKTDVVAEFARICQVNLTALNTRSLERSEPAETLLRAAFNNRYHQEVLPDLFNRAILNTQNKVPSMTDLAELAFEYNGIDEVIEKHHELFKYMSEKLGPEFSFSENKSKNSKRPDPVVLQSRIIDYLIQISFRQADRITQLEKDVQALKSKL